MTEEGFIFRLFQKLEWIMLFAYMQFVWMIFIVIGLGLFGFIPSTVAMFSMTRKMLSGHTDVSVFPYMWNIYKNEFIKSNLYFYSLLIPGGVIYFYIRFFMFQEIGVSTILFMLSVGIGVLYLISIVVAMPVYVHYHLNILSFYKTIWLIVLTYPFHMITIGVTLVGFYHVMRWIPGLFPFLSFSILAFLIMWISNLIFSKIDEKQVISMEG